ncbi:hypothetical protein NST50_14000 [Paenibacillus sp. FSL E2-0202]|uniref:hypothetical protein n=1 Tax=Paenibacillus sp. FSL E2-0202 TaxID=2954505 RepID=UPI0030EC5EE7
MTNPMTPERIEEIKPYFTNEQLDELSREYRTMPTDGEGYAIEPEYEGMAARGNIVKLVSDLKASMAALEEAQQEAHKQKEEAKRLNEICNQLAGEEMMFQDGKYETEMQRLENKLSEAQQQVKDLKEDKRKILAVHDEQCARSSEYYNELIFVKGKQAEAQQTIANAKRIFETADAETVFDDVLHGMYGALGGNKEGSDKA